MTETIESAAAVPDVRRWARIAIIGAVSVLVLACSWWRTPALFDLDDPYIVLHSAQVLASHRPDPIFGTPALTGVTSPAYLALVLAFLETHVPPVQALRLASAIGTAALAGAIWWAGA